jgi:hypothetical protein
LQVCASSCKKPSCFSSIVRTCGQSKLCYLPRASCCSKLSIICSSIRSILSYPSGWLSSRLCSLRVYSRLTTSLVL